MPKEKGVLCPKCNSEEHKVVDKRAGWNKIKRRRECLKCGHRFNTWEKIISLK